MFVRLFDGAMHDEDSHGLDFELAALEGFKEAARLSKPRLLEPIMELIVEGPAEYTGAITADISRRRGQIKQIDATHGKQLITADVPLESLFKYIGSLRSLTAGRAAAHISFSHYAVASKEAQQKLLMAS